MWGWLARALDTPPSFDALADATGSACGAVAAIDARLGETALSSLAAAAAGLASLERTVAAIDAGELARIRTAVDVLQTRLERFREVVVVARRLKARSIDQAWPPGEPPRADVRSARRPLS